MPHFITPNSFGTLRELNDCHSPKDGKFCSGPGGTSRRAGLERKSLGIYQRPEGSVRIPEYLKPDVGRAMRAGIVTYHRQQPEPVKDITGKINDPLAMSNARRGEETFYTDKRSQGVAKKGYVRMTTRGGEFEPTYTQWGEYGPRGTARKELTPDDLKNPASKGDVLSTYRHEVGHIMDENFYGNKSGTVPAVIAREIRAWTHAVEIAPTHRVSERMVRAGLESHGYFELRRAEFVKEWKGKINSWDLDASTERMVRNELKNGVMHGPTLERSRAMADRVVKSLQKYGATLRKRGIGAKAVRGPKPYLGPRWKMWSSNPDRSEMYRPTPGPGGRGIL